MSEPAADAPSDTAAPADAALTLAEPKTEGMPRDFQDGLRYGRVDMMIQSLVDEARAAATGHDLPPGEVEALALEKCAKYALEVRRKNVAVLGSHEAYVRHTGSGSLRQVIKPVRLSLGDGRLYQIPANKPVCTNRDHQCFGQVVNHRRHDKSDHEWRPVVAEPHKANVSYPGYLAMNAVAGCQVIQPPHVMVDGEKKSNPYVQRASGRGGDIERIIINMIVLGPTPATGNPVAVNYILDYDPTKELANQLSHLAEKIPQEVYLVTANDEIQKGWGHLTIGAGLAFTFNLRCKDIVRAVKDYINIQANALKKSMTVCRRNAMKAHPALAVQQVVIDPARGVAMVPVTGWVPDDDTMERWVDLSTKLAKGIAPEDIIDDVEIIEHEYDESDAADSKAYEGRTPDGEEVEHEVDQELMERNGHIEYIDDNLAMLTSAQRAQLKYRPGKMTTEQLRVARDLVDKFLDAPAS